MGDQRYKGGDWRLEAVKGGAVLGEAAVNGGEVLGS